MAKGKLRIWLVLGNGGICSSDWWHISESVDTYGSPLRPTCVPAHIRVVSQLYNIFLPNLEGSPKTCNVGCAAPTLLVYLFTGSDTPQGRFGCG